MERVVSVEWTVDCGRGCGRWTVRRTLVRFRGECSAGLVGKSNETLPMFCLIGQLFADLVGGRRGLVYYVKAGNGFNS